MNHHHHHNQKLKKKRKRKRKSSETSSSISLILPQILASLTNFHTNFSQTLLLQHLNTLHRKSTKTLTLIDNNFFLSLLPPLLRTATKSTTSPSIAQRTAEIIGAISLQSYESNLKITSDDEILKALLDALLCGNECVSAATCNAVLDLCTTSIARQRLCELKAVEKLLSYFLQYTNLSSKDVSSCTMGEGTHICTGGGIIKDAFKGLILDATVRLINGCNVKQLSEIPEKLSKITLGYLEALWVQVRDQSLERDVNRSKDKIGVPSIGKTKDLLESIFRLSINSGHFTSTRIYDKLRRTFFGPNQSDFEHFIFNYWENSPVLLRKFSGHMDASHDALCSLVQSFNSEEIHDVLLTLLEGLVGCPPLPSDELNILNFLKETKDRLGHPIISGQDIRVVKAVETLGNDRGKLKREVHLLKDCSPDLCNIGDVQECEKAYQEGYTIAMRGMEFRSQNIASIADELAGLFGQPSVGANAYLTPPRSQGLARHYDDHCVFVCQLLGKKKWKVFSHSTLHLPRLYEPLDNGIGSEGELSESECKQFLLGEGDILYIPRGCPHEACTILDGGGSNLGDAFSGCSLHLTLGIEVEPPFEWEGFAHVGLHVWNQKMKPPLETLGSSFGRTMYSMSTSLLHIAIQQIGAIDPTFAKACMVSTCFSSSRAPDNDPSTMLQSQRTIFSYVINKINRDVGFLDVLESIKVAVEERNADIFQRLRWLRQLCPEEDMKGLDWDNPLTEFENFLLLINAHRVDAETAFLQVKSRFCREVVLEDVFESFTILLHKYKRVRTQYMNGMLSLHSNAKIS